MANVFERAIVFATKAHEGMVRKAEGRPYICHPLEVASIASSMTDDVEVLAAAVLHDTVEDTPTTLDEIEQNFGPRVAALVGSETENKRRDQSAESTWRIRKEESLAELERGGREVKILWLSDKLSNMRSILRQYREKGSELWEVFNQSDPDEQAWYYMSAAQFTSELSDEQAWQEFTEIIEEVFEEELS